MVFSEVPFMSELSQEYLKVVKCLGMSHRPFWLKDYYWPCHLLGSAEYSVQILVGLSSEQIHVHGVPKKKDTKLKNLWLADKHGNLWNQILHKVKVVWQHEQGVVGSLITTLLQICYRISQWTNFENWLIFNGQYCHEFGVWITSLVLYFQIADINMFEW